MNLVNHCLWWQIKGMISLRIWQITYFGDTFSDEFGIKSVTTLSNQFGDKSSEKY